MASKKMFEVALLLTAKDEATRKIGMAAVAAESQMKRFSSMGDKAFAVGRGAGIAGIAGAGVIGVVSKAAEDSEIAYNRLRRTFKTMGETNDDAAKKAADYASKLQMSIGVEDEQIEAVQSKIATFRKVSDETARMSGTFDRATKAAFDMAAGGFGEASQNAVLLGKALQDPARGATALARIGAINKSDVPLIKQIQATKGLAAAQEFVLKKVEKQVSGQAEVNATATSKMKVKWAEVAETLGRTTLPTFNKVLDKVGKLADKFQSWASANPKTLSTITKITIGATGLAFAISGLSFVFGGLFKVVAAAMWIKKQYIFWTNLTTMAENGSKTAKIALRIATLASAAAQWVMNASLYGCPIVWIIAGIMLIIGVVWLLVKNWDKVSAFFKVLWANIKTMFWQAWEFIKKWGVLFLGPVGFIIKYWDQIKGFFSRLWPSVKAIFMKGLEFFLWLPKKFLSIGIDIVMGLWNGIKSKAAALFNFVKEIGSKVANAFKSVLGINSPSKVFMQFGTNITEGATEGIKKGSGKTIAASGGMGAAMTPNRARGGSGGGSSAVTVNFAPVINGGNSAEIMSQLDKYADVLMRKIEDKMARRQRLGYS